MLLSNRMNNKKETLIIIIILIVTFCGLHLFFKFLGRVTPPPYSRDQEISLTSRCYDRFEEAVIIGGVHEQKKGD